MIYLGPTLKLVGYGSRLWPIGVDLCRAQCCLLSTEVGSHHKTYYQPVLRSTLLDMTSLYRLLHTWRGSTSSKALNDKTKY